MIDIDQTRPNRALSIYLDLYCLQGIRVSNPKVLAFCIFSMIEVNITYVLTA